MVNPAWLEKDYQGKISALDYFMFYVLFDDRQFDALGYGLGPQIQIWLLLPYRISFLSIL
jgi:hypothetical protein